MTNRRLFLLAMAFALAAPPLAAQHRSSQARVGILNYASDGDVRVRQFQDALRDLGYLEGRNLELILRSAEGNIERLPELAADLVAENVDVMIALGPAAWAAKRATTSVPVVIAFSGDPVGDGIVPSIARPGGNMTGFSYMSSELAAKRLELAVDAFSKNKRVGVLYNPREPATRLEMRMTEAAAKSLGVTLLPIAAEYAGGLEDAFQQAIDQRADGLVVLTHGFAVLNGARIIALAETHRLPILYGWRDFVDEGGLMSYGPEIGALVRRAAIYVDLIIKGARPGDLPIEQPTRLQFVVNLKTAKAIDLTISPSILLRADEVIE